MRVIFGIVAVAAATAVGVGCGQAGEATDAATTPSLSIPADAGHVHGIVRSAAGRLLIATHRGMFSPADDGTLRKRGDDDDYMGLAALAAGPLLSSGHPGPSSTEPDPLGLRQSRDGGTSWTTIARVPRDDFHVIKSAAGMIYAVGSDGAMYAGRTPATMARTAQAPAGLIDLAINPARGNDLVAATRSGLTRSADGGRSWTPLGTQAGLLSWPREDHLYIVDADGAISVSDDGGTTWSRRGALGSPPAAILAESPRNLVAATHDGGIVRSSDGARTWS